MTEGVNMFNGKTPSEIMDLIENMKDELDKERQHTTMDSAERQRIDRCLAYLDDVFNEAVAQDIASRTERVTKLKDALSGATTELQNLKKSIEAVIDALNTAVALVNTGRSLLAFL
jgi:DNA anti-recombination protein RmuC